MTRMLTDDEMATLHPSELLPHSTPIPTQVVSSDELYPDPLARSSTTALASPELLPNTHTLINTPRPSPDATRLSTTRYTSTRDTTLARFTVAPPRHARETFLRFRAPRTIQTVMTSADGYNLLNVAGRFSTLSPGPEIGVHFTPPRRAANKRWAELIYRIFEIDPSTCTQCGGEMKILAFITEPGLIRTILDHRDRIAAEPRAPPPLAQTDNRQ